MQPHAFSIWLGIVGVFQEETTWKKIDKDIIPQFLSKAAMKMGIGKCKSKHYQYKDNLFKQFIADVPRLTPNRDKNVVKIIPKI